MTKFIVPYGLLLLLANILVWGVVGNSGEFHGFAFGTAVFSANFALLSFTVALILRAIADQRSMLVRPGFLRGLGFLVIVCLKLAFLGWSAYVGLVVIGLPAPFFVFGNVVALGLVALVGTRYQRTLSVASLS